jgi:hypothetical protein
MSTIDILIVLRTMYSVTLIILETIKMRVMPILPTDYAFDQYSRIKAVQIRPGIAAITSLVFDI